MPVRELGAIAARVLAVLAVLKGLQMAAGMAVTLGIPEGVDLSTFFRPVVASAAVTLATWLIALYLWFRAGDLWPSDGTVHLDINAIELRRLVLGAAGWLLIVLAGSDVLANIYWIWANRQPMDGRAWLELSGDVIRVGLGIALVVWNRLPSVIYELDPEDPKPSG